jgi:hypothetical protein
MQDISSILTNSEKLECLLQEYEKNFLKQNERNNYRFAVTKIPPVCLLMQILIIQK